MLIGVDGGPAGSRRHARACVEELAALAATAGADVVDRLYQRRPSIHPATFLSRGKLQQLRSACEKSAANLVIFDEDLSPAQVKSLEQRLRVKILDRSELILDIFSRRARTREAMTQVELAQLEYLLPRLSGMWEHLSRLGGGIGTRGPGETQLEVDRRQVRRKISVLRRRLEAIDRERDIQTRRRRESFRICLVGYTNAGKSTLFNALTQAGVTAEDKLFATLETTTRRLWIEGGPVVLLSDTVGFLRKLPHHLVASFRATLREVTEADLLIHVADAGHPDLADQIRAVNEVLDDLLDRRVSQLLVLSKMDRVTDEVRRQALRVDYPGALLISAFNGGDVGRVRDRIAEEIQNLRHRVRIRYPYSLRGRLQPLLARGQRVDQQYENEKISEEIWIDPADLDRLQREGVQVEILDGAVGSPGA
ncbi:MAG: GTPase HflX [Candidatus Eisenbacteria bacterium]|nr:GTPase HflX [Candidatus Eisenbacteria bacterium]